MNKNSLTYSTKEINRNFRIKVAGVDANGNKINKLVGVSGAIALIGIELLNKFLTRTSTQPMMFVYVSCAEV